MLSVDVFIPSYGRPCLWSAVDAWITTASELSSILSIQIQVLPDGISHMDDWSDLPLHPYIQEKECSERPGDLVWYAIQDSKADYVVHGFDDDPPSDVDILIQAAESSGAMWASGKVAEYCSGEPTGVVYTGQPSETLINRNAVPLQGCVFRREVFTRVPFVCVETLPWTYDWELALRLMYAKEPHAHVDKVVGIWNLNSSGMTQSNKSAVHTRLWQARREYLCERKNRAHLR